MKIKLSRSEAREKIDSFFEKKSFTPEEVRKIKRLAMKFKIRLGSGLRRKFCKKCLAKLKGKTRVSKFFKTVECENCGTKNRFRLS